MLQDRRSVMTGSPLSALVSNWKRKGIIRSIQQGTVAPNNTSATYDATITTVDPNNSIIIPLWFSGGATDVRDLMGRWSILNATTARYTFGSANNNNLTVGFVVVEFVPGVIKSRQAGSISLTNPAASNTATITNVATDKTFLIATGITFDTAGTQQWSYAAARIVLTNATTITATSAAPAPNGIQTVGYQAVELF